jgi:flavin reductase (DIM6/NTAB) family NADH-FMN oxidoreductase RutF/DNA-binding GntR family transcriptional regulator
VSTSLPETTHEELHVHQHSHVATDGASDDPIDAATFRQVIGNLASGVTVITSRFADTDYGMTASSVTSLSMEPPMMLVCINNAVPTSRAIKEIGRYGVSILRQAQEDVAYNFAVPRDDKFRGIGIRRSSTGIPMIDGALAQIECDVVEEVIGGTHTIFLGQVVSATASEGPPLTYFRGGFGRFEFATNDAVYHRARTLILDRVYGASAVIGVDELADRLDVDRTAAFYALTRLAADGLVRRDPTLGHVVSPFDVRVSDETFDARLAIELGAIGMVTGHVAADALAELRCRFEVMSSYLVADQFTSFTDYLDANFRFHEYLVGLAGNALLTSTFRRLSIKSVMTRSFGSTSATSSRFIDVQRALVEAMETADRAAAELAARDYCELAKARTRQILALTGGTL